jgi:ABC-type Fe3+/spermidine/putrescine transport system ATPase subunit
MPETVLELRSVTRRFGSVIAVDGLSETLRRGEYFCILGPSGCGKTTLLRLIAGFDTPDSGSILLHGSDVAETPPERRDVNVVFQSYALFPHLTVRENIGFGLRMKKISRAEIARRVGDAIALVHLEAETDRLPRQLSGGQQQRVALARAVVNRPAVLLLDEPLSALDQSLRIRMQAELRTIQRETGIAFLHITHDQMEALSIADRVAVMRAGRFEQVAPPQQIYRQPATRFVAEFVGGTNLIPARGDTPDTVILTDGVRVTGLHPSAFSGDVLLALRPETLTLVAPEDGLLRGRVVSTAFTGHAVEYTIVTASAHTLRVRTAAGTSELPAEGDEVGIALDAATAVVLPAS